MGEGGKERERELGPSLFLGSAAGNGQLVAYVKLDTLHTTTTYLFVMSCAISLWNENLNARS